MSSLIFNFQCFDQLKLCSSSSFVLFHTRDFRVKIDQLDKKNIQHISILTNHFLAGIKLIDDRLSIRMCLCSFFHSSSPPSITHHFTRRSIHKLSMTKQHHLYGEYINPTVTFLRIFEK